MLNLGKIYVKTKNMDKTTGKIDPDHPFFELIEEAYRVFECPKPTKIGVCENCCMDPKIEADFFTLPLRDVPLAYLHDWFFAACSPGEMPQLTWGYMLPRLLECLAAGESPNMIGVEIVLYRFLTGDAANWSTEEWSVLDRFQRMLLEVAVTDVDPVTGKEVSTWQSDAVLCLFGRAGWPLDDLFAQLMAFRDEDIAYCWPGMWWEGKPSFNVTAHWADLKKDAEAFYLSETWSKRMAALAGASGAERKLADRAREIVRVIDALA